MYTVFPTFSFTRLNNPEFTSLMLNVQKHIEATDYESLGLTTARMTQMRNDIKKLVDQTYVSTASPLTKAMNGADEDRSRIFRRIRLKLSTVEMADKGSDLAEIAETVQINLLQKYGAKVANMPIQEKTAVIQGFVLDVRTKLTEDHLLLLGIEQDIVALEQANGDFVSAHTERTSERAELESERTATLRSSLTDIFMQLTFAVQHFANSDDADLKTQAETCQGFIKALNVLLTEAKKRLDIRKKQGGDNESNADTKPGNGSSDQKPGTGGNGGNTGGGGSGSDSGGSTPGGPTLDDDMIAW